MQRPFQREHPASRPIPRPTRAQGRLAEFLRPPWVSSRERSAGLEGGGRRGSDAFSLDYPFALSVLSPSGETPPDEEGIPGLSTSLASGPTNSQSLPRGNRRLEPPLPFLAPSPPFPPSPVTPPVPFFLSPPFSSSLSIHLFSFLLLTFFSPSFNLLSSFLLRTTSLLSLLFSPLASSSSLLSPVLPLLFPVIPFPISLSTSSIFPLCHLILLSFSFTIPFLLTPCQLSLLYPCLSFFLLPLSQFHPFLRIFSSPRVIPFSHSLPPLILPLQPPLSSPPITLFSPNSLLPLFFSSILTFFSPFILSPPLSSPLFTSLPSPSSYIYSVYLSHPLSLHPFTCFLFPVYFRSLLISASLFRLTHSITIITNILKINFLVLTGNHF
ncbi:hypothetical protein C7M84_001257 [Penaeus vannamei]|uniref:Uncharacterized protein n=1 Tax=Penaeus vannamei TaxID=6689 RepID=A0A423TUE0_PENVA|nr:hypothetical protein C7M84_001257 [Penaeus vannamei]